MAESNEDLSQNLSVSSVETEDQVDVDIDSPSAQNYDSDEEAPTYQVLEKKDVVNYQNEIIAEVNAVINLSPAITRVLLHQFRWDKEKFFEKYFDTSPEIFFKKVHVINPFDDLPQKSSQTSKFVEACDICFQLKTQITMEGLECGHLFCDGCWKEYLRVKIMHEGIGQTITCPAHDCDIIVCDQLILNLISDEEVLKRYQHLLTNSFVDCNALLRWCPGVNCTYAIRANTAEWHQIHCKCGHIFCFKCGQRWHDPVKCIWLAKWIKKCDDDSETSNWIAANTKECPKCNITIEKNGGCNHMVCKNQNCKYDFCWVCLGPWEPHGTAWYSCNRYEEADARAARDAQEVYRSSLARYLHYYNRYMNHMLSLRFENKLYADVNKKMEAMQLLSMSWIEVQFLQKAVDVLCQCRETLMYTYVFAYYLKRDNQSEIFEGNQKDLEQATEILSEYLEREITSDNLSDIKQRVQDKYLYCAKRRKVLLKHVHEGYDKDWWRYTEAI